MHSRPSSAGGHVLPRRWSSCSSGGCPTKLREGDPAAGVVQVRTQVRPACMHLPAAASRAAHAGAQTELLVAAALGATQGWLPVIVRCKGQPEGGATGHTRNGR